MTAREWVELCVYEVGALARTVSPAGVTSGTDHEWTPRRDRGSHRPCRFFRPPPSQGQAPNR